ncbi:hypothetical protein DNTS_031705 [Danionella cerebrum]|uniref:Cytosolic carboxypeptidase N-terminal domain-containing protein n=1 Tax=Danionella cerebrum TaxID=2873325 RepID=A0A553R811_9TELE|nr:hypothetical protein DNTS_031705 [Danionella translucida]
MSEGNLGRVDYISEFEFDLFIRPDTCNPRFRVWFNFTVENVRETQSKTVKRFRHLESAQRTEKKEDGRRDLDPTTGQRDMMGGVIKVSRGLEVHLCDQRRPSLGKRGSQWGSFEWLKSGIWWLGDAVLVEASKNGRVLAKCRTSARSHTALGTGPSFYRP